MNTATAIDFSIAMNRQTIAVLIAQTLAGAKLPAEIDRIARATQIVLQGNVHPQNATTTLVDSQGHFGTQYPVTANRCLCPDATFTAPDGRCKHVLSVLLDKKATTLMQRQWVASDSQSGQHGMATEVVEGCWLFSTPQDPTPKYVPLERLVLGGNYALMATA